MIRMMTLSKSLLIVAVQALLAVERHAFFGIGRSVRVVAGGAGHPASWSLSSLAFPQGLPLAGGPRVCARLPAIDKYVLEIREVISRRKPLDPPAFADHRGVTFEMTVQANR